MMTVHFTCKNCGSGIHVYPSVEAHRIKCDVCDAEQEVKFDHDHEQGILKVCP